MLAKLTKNHFIRDSRNLVNTIDVCVKESTFEHLPIDYSEACLLGSAKIKKKQPKQKIMRQYWTNVPFPPIKALKFS